MVRYSRTEMVSGQLDYGQLVYGQLDYGQLDYGQLVYALILIFCVIYISPEEVKNEFK